MLNDFINKTVKILRDSDIRIHMPEHCEVEIKEHPIQRMNLVSKCCINKLEDNLIFHLMVFFSLLDSFIDSKFPELDGISFKQKYLRLRRESDNEIIIKEVFRILKIFRNASTHSKSAIIIQSNSNILVNYQFNRTDFTLNLTKKALVLIYYVIFLFLDNERYSKYYLSGLLRTYYDDLKSEIMIINDDIGNCLDNISNGLRLKRIRRYKVLNPIYKLDSSTGTISICRFNVPELESQYCSCDYLVKLHEENYLIPDEVLGQIGDISLSESENWKLENIV